MIAVRFAYTCLGVKIRNISASYANLPSAFKNCK